MLTVETAHEIHDAAQAASPFMITIPRKHFEFLWQAYSEYLERDPSREKDNHFIVMTLDDMFFSLRKRGRTVWRVRS